MGAERAHAGLAEEIPLATGSVRAVTVADAFHWFDHAAALAEIARVLAPGGGLAVITTAVDWSGASWAHELGSLIMRLRPEHPQFDGPPWQQALAASGCWEEAREVRLSAPAPAQLERIADHIASMSWVAAMPAEQRAATLAHVRRLLERARRRRNWRALHAERDATAAGAPREPQKAAPCVRIRQRSVQRQV